MFQVKGRRRHYLLQHGGALKRTWALDLHRPGAHTGLHPSPAGRHQAREGLISHCGLVPNPKEDSLPGLRWGLKDVSIVHTSLGTRCSGNNCCNLHLYHCYYRTSNFHTAFKPLCQLTLTICHVTSWSTTWLFNSHNDPMRWILCWSPLHKERNWGPGRWMNCLRSHN